MAVRLSPARKHSRKWSVWFPDDAIVVSQPAQRSSCFDSYCYRGWLVTLTQPKLHQPSALLLGPPQRPVNSFRGGSYCSRAGCAAACTCCTACVVWGDQKTAVGWPQRHVQQSRALIPSTHVRMKDVLLCCANESYFTALWLQRHRCSGHCTVNPQHRTKALLIFTTRDLFGLAFRNVPVPLWILNEAIRGLAKTLLLSG